MARRYGSSLVLLEHYPAPESGEGLETLDLVRTGADGSPHWSRVWPTPQENPRHAGMAEARSRDPRARPLADRPRPGAPSGRTAAVMAARDVTA